MTTPLIQTLADTALGNVRCRSCGVVIQSSALVEVYPHANLWFLVFCKRCKKFSPFPSESLCQTKP